MLFFAIPNLVSIPIVVLIALCSTSGQKESFVLARNCIVQLTLLPRNSLNSLNESEQLHKEIKMQSTIVSVSIQKNKC